MSGMAPPDLAARLSELERQLADLRARLVVLEKLLQGRTLPPRKENPDDRSAVREKVTYDWQS